MFLQQFTGIETHRFRPTFVEVVNVNEKDFHVCKADKMNFIFSKEILRCS